MEIIEGITVSRAQERSQMIQTQSHCGQDHYSLSYIKRETRTEVDDEIKLSVVQIENGRLVFTDEDKTESIEQYLTRTL